MQQRKVAEEELASRKTARQQLRRQEQERLDRLVDQQSEESFPASDAPSRYEGRGTRYEGRTKPRED